MRSPPCRSPRATTSTPCSDPLPPSPPFPSLTQYSLLLSLTRPPSLSPSLFARSGAHAGSLVRVRVSSASAGVHGGCAHAAGLRCAGRRCVALCCDVLRLSPLCCIVLGCVVALFFPGAWLCGQRRRSYHWLQALAGRWSVTLLAVDGLLASSCWLYCQGIQSSAVPSCMMPSLWSLIPPTMTR